MKPEVEFSEGLARAICDDLFASSEGAAKMAPLVACRIRSYLCPHTSDPEPQFPPTWVVTEGCRTDSNADLHVAPSAEDEALEVLAGLLREIIAELRTQRYSHGRSGDGGSLLGGVG